MSPLRSHRLAVEFAEDRVVPAVVHPGSLWSVPHPPADGVIGAVVTALALRPESAGEDNVPLAVPVKSLPPVGPSTRPDPGVLFTTVRQAVLKFESAPERVEDRPADSLPPDRGPGLHGAGIPGPLDLLAKDAESGRGDVIPLLGTWVDTHPGTWKLVNEITDELRRLVSDHPPVPVDLSPLASRPMSLSTGPADGAPPRPDAAQQAGIPNDPATGPGAPVAGAGSFVSFWVGPATPDGLPAASPPRPRADDGQTAEPGGDSPDDAAGPPVAVGLEPPPVSVGDVVAFLADLPAGVPLAGTLPVDLAALEDGAAVFLDHLTDLGVDLPDGSERSAALASLAAAAVLAGGVAYAAFVNPPRRRAYGAAPGPDSVLARWEEKNDRRPG